MGEITINPIHNVHKKYRTMNLVNPYIFAPPVDLSTNTEIGGVASTISTPALLATKLGIDVSRITNFTIVGSDIKCKITGNYAIPAAAFSTYGGNFPNTLTYYNDTDNLCTYIGHSAFYIQTNFSNFTLNAVTTIDYNAFPNTRAKEYYLPAVTSLLNYQHFSDCSNSEVFYLPLCTVYGTSPSVNDGVFSNIKSGVKIYAHPSTATNNSNGVDADLAYAISQGASVRYVTNFTAPLTPTLTSIGTIYNTAVQLVDAGGSTNAIDYFEVTVNGVPYGNVNAGSYITGLIASTNYNITLKAVDIFYNKSVVSNSLSVSTTNTVLDTDASAYMVASVNGQWQPAIDNLYTSLKLNSLYTKIQAFYPFLGTTAAQHKWNGKNPLDTDGANRLVFTGSPTFSNNGYLVGGGHANTFLIPNSVQNVNSNGLTVIIGTNNAANTNDTAIGAFGSGSNASWIVVKGNNTTYLRESRINFAAVQQTGTNEAKGIWTGTRQSSTVSKLFRNSTLIGSVTATGTLPTYPIWIGDLNNNGSAYGSTSQRIQFTAIHEGLSDAEVATLHTIIDIFETALGRKTW